MIYGGKITKVRFETVWVDAWIDYIPSRGARHKTQNPKPARDLKGTSMIY
jgi:hypothetical protein